jgi:hypothetical protein
MNQRRLQIFVRVDISKVYLLYVVMCALCFVMNAKMGNILWRAYRFQMKKYTKLNRFDSGLQDADFVRFIRGKYHN